MHKEMLLLKYDESLADAWCMTESITEKVLFTGTKTA
jgi:hypothetical protein